MMKRCRTRCVACSSICSAFFSGTQRIVPRLPDPFEIRDNDFAQIAGDRRCHNHHEVTLVQLSFEFYMIEAKPESLIGDKAYDSDHLDQEMRAEGIEMIAPNKSNRRRKTRDGRRLRRYERRWIVERFFARIQWQRRLLIRWEYYPTNFVGFVQLAALCILLKQF
jgi:transposase